MSRLISTDRSGEFTLQLLKNEYEGLREHVVKKFGPRELCVICRDCCLCDEQTRDEKCNQQELCKIG